jgi:hypothetical protein
VDKPSGAEDRRRQFQAHLGQLIERADHGDGGALAELRQLLDDDPALAAHFGDLARYAESAWLVAVAEGSVIKYEAAQRHLARLKAELAGPHPTTLEQILADQVAISCLADRHAQYHEGNTTGGTPQQVALRLKRSESTQRRLLTAVKMLTTLRAMVPHGLTPPDSIRLHAAEEREAV